jgi:hypothetical protein
MNQLMYVAEWTFTPKQLHARFSETGKQYGTALRAKRLRVEKGYSGYTFSIEINPHLGFAGNTDWQQRVVSIIFLGQGDGSLSSGLNILLAMGQLISAVSPDLSLDEKGSIFEQLGFSDDDVDFREMDRKTVYRGVAYHVTKTDGSPVMLTITPDE